MTFAHLWILHFLWTLPLVAFVLMVRHRRRQRALQRFAEKNLLKRLAPEDHKGKRLLKALLLLLAFGGLIVALAGPRWGSHFQEVSRKGVDIMILVDVSRSMMVEDVEPNRLERAKREIIDFLKVIEGDRVGLTAFAGAAFVQCPLTLDYAALEMFLNVLKPGIIPVAGTDLGTAIETGISVFDAKAETDKVMVLITDGEDNENRGLDAARKAAGQNIKIFVFGIGDPSGGPIPAGKDQGGFKKDKTGSLVLSKLDEKILQNIAMETGGGYVRSMAGDLDLDILYFDGIKKRTAARTLKSGKIKVYEEHFHLFVLAAFFFLLLEGLLDGKRLPHTGRGGSLFMLFMVTGLTFWLCLPPAFAAESPDELYRQGRYEEAQQAYARQDMDHPKDIRFRYNRGCAAFQNGKFKEAMAAFSSVMRRAENKDVRFKAAFNLGNTAFKQGDYASAVMYFKQALLEQPSSENARYNLELSLRALKKDQEKPTQEPADAPPSNKPPQESGRNTQEETDTPEKGNDSSDQEPRPQKNQNPAAAQTISPESTDENPLSGELKPRESMSELEATEPLKAHRPADIDRKKAEALLDNVQEDPSQLMRFMITDENREKSFSGRDW
jgi:Ca-activated chloride channel family protein